MQLFRSGQRNGSRWRWIAVALLAVPALLATGRAAFFRGSILPPEPLPAQPFLDMHCHLAGIGTSNSGCFVSERLRKSWKLGFYVRSFGVSRRELEEQGDFRCGDQIGRTLAANRLVNRAVILAMDGVVDAQGNLDLARTEFYVPNEFVAALAARQTNLLFGASINPDRPDSLARLDWAGGDQRRLPGKVAAFHPTH